MTHILTSRGRNKRMRGDRGGDNTFRVTGFVGWSNGVFHVVEFGVLLVSTRKARTYRDQPAVPSLSTFCQKVYKRVGPNMTRDSASRGTARTPPGGNRSPETSQILCRTASDTAVVSIRIVAVLDIPYLYSGLGYQRLPYSRSIRIMMFLG